MTALEYLAIKRRICKESKSKSDCCTAECPLAHSFGNSLCFCWEYETKDSEEVILKAKKWAEEHPPKTILQDYLEKYPAALIAMDGTPEICPDKLGHRKNDKCGDCVACWNRPLGVKK